MGWVHGCERDDRPASLDLLFLPRTWRSGRFTGKRASLLQQFFFFFFLATSMT